MAGNPILVPLPEVLNGASAAGATVNIKCPIGRTYHAILLECTNVTLAEIEDIRIVANGDTIARYDSGTDLDALNQAEGITAAGAGDFSNPLIIPFDRFGLRTRDVAEITALGTGLADDPNAIVSLSVEIDVATGATGATVAAKALQSAASASGIIRETKLLTYVASASGTFEISDIPRLGNISRIWFKNGNVDAIKILRDNLTVWEATAATNNFISALEGYRAAPSTDLLVDFGSRGFGLNSLKVSGVSDLRFQLTMGASGTIPVYVEYLKPLTR